MKNFIVIILATIALQPAFAQLKNTKWEGAIKGESPRNGILDFKKDTLIFYASAGDEVIETMTYKISGNTFTVTKIAGQSDCDNTIQGKYGFELKGGKMSIKLINDACGDRSSALDITNWTKKKINH